MSALEIARRFYGEILNEANLDAVDELAAPDFVLLNPTYPNAFRGPDGLREFVTTLHEAVPDVHFTVEHLLAEGDTIVSHTTADGTHSGAPLRTVMGEIPASGRHFAIDGMAWLTVRDGRIVESLGNEDTVGLLMQLGAIPAPEPAPPETSREQAETLVHRYFELLNEGRFDTIDEIATDNFAFRIPTLPEAVRGREGLRQFVTGLRTGFPDIHFEIEQLIVDGDKAAARWTITGTQDGEFLGIPPTGNHIHDQGIDVFRFANGQIADVWVNENDLGLLQQLGAIPTAVTA